MTNNTLNYYPGTGERRRWWATSLGNIALLILLASFFGTTLWTVTHR